VCSSDLQGGKVATEKVVRQLKTEESRKLGSSTQEEENDFKRKPSPKPQRTISRTNNIFKRF
jgi:hypothetical protein